MLGNIVWDRIMRLYGFFVCVMMIEMQREVYRKLGFRKEGEMMLEKESVKGIDVESG